ncbi:MAG: aminotransferase class III-fold pyridoxal phosphate-dependent enzyme [Bryobacterales bacterium]|nr:aminotransferase class III-fold pyridoxal phosphate-dependent enzyme [Bryobacterales bacterium]
MPGRTGPELYRKAKTRIPGGTQLLSKRPELFLPEEWPAYFSRARGAEVWDLDGRKLLDMSYCGIGATILGYADPDVNQAVHAAVDAGSMTTLNCPEEVELADLLCELHPWAEMVRYARGGGEAMAIAVRIARACTGRDKVILCGYHGWTDWYVAANLASTEALDGHLLPGIPPAGVPRSLAGTTLTFHYNQPGELEATLDANSRQVAAIVMEPMRSRPPEPGFLQRVRRLADAAGAVLIFDEITAALRVNSGGIHLTLGVNPDIAVFAKAISNGYPMAAIIGTAPVMQAAQDTFISSTYWTERIGPAAALATLAKHRRVDAGRRLVAIGERIQQGWRTAAASAGLPLTVDGLPPLSHFTPDVPGAQAVRTLFTQKMLDRGFLATNSFYAMYAHQPVQVDLYLEACAEVFRELRQAIEHETVRSELRGPVALSGFARLT